MWRWVLTVFICYYYLFIYVEYHNFQYSAHFFSYVSAFFLSSFLCVYFICVVDALNYVNTLLSEDTSLRESSNDINTIERNEM